MKDRHRRRDRSKATFSEIHLDCMLFRTTAGQDSTEASSLFTILHAVDIETLMRITVVGQKGMIEHVISTVVSFLYELGHQRVLLKSDTEPFVPALTHEVSR